MGHHVYRLDRLRLHPIERGQSPNKIGYQRKCYSSRTFGVTTQLVYFPMTARNWARYLITQAHEAQAVIGINH
jgi:hypothetical protein